MERGINDNDSSSASYTPLIEENNEIQATSPKVSTSDDDVDNDSLSHNTSLNNHFHQHFDEPVLRNFEKTAKITPFVVTSALIVAIGGFLFGKKEKKMERGINDNDSSSASYTPLIEENNEIQATSPKVSTSDDGVDNDSLPHNTSLNNHFHQHFDEPVLRNFEKTAKITPFVVTSALIVAIGVISGAMLLIEREFTMTAFQKGMVVGATTIGALFGGLGAGSLSDFAGRSLSDFAGRRITSILAAIVFLVGSLIITFAGTYYLLVVGRFVVGLATGIASMVVPIYISEISPRFHRGRLVTMNVLLITGGQVIAYLVGVFFVSNGGWRWMFGVSIIPPIIQLVCMPFVPESPRYLVKSGKPGEAMDGTMLKMAGFAIIKEAIVFSILLSITNFVMTDRVGRRTILLYTIIATIIGLFLLGVGFASIIGFVPKQVACTDYGTRCAACVIDDRCGFSKRLGGICSPKTDYEEFYDSCPDGNVLKSLFALFTLMLFITGYALGLGHAPWLIQSELFPLNIRGRASGVATGISLIFL
ncbi:3290_t:CDS:10 [Entrophospora sp. SA101]|nr:3290_t:CDS:10 [Entrophospora sp. SA101]